MTASKYHVISGLFFAAVALGHLLRLIYACEMTICDWTVPLWMSWFALVLPGGLSIWGFSLAKKK